MENKTLQLQKTSGGGGCCKRIIKAFFYVGVGNVCFLFFVGFFDQKKKKQKNCGVGRDWVGWFKMRLLGRVF